MKRVTLHLTEQEIAALHAMARATGLKWAEVVRRILDRAIEEERVRQQRVRE